MQPLLDIRNELAEAGRETRDFRRMHGKVSLYNGQNVPGPYHQEARAHWLRKVLEAQTWVREHGPEDVRDIELITLPELHEIRRIWVHDKHEHEDYLPDLYEEATGECFSGPDNLGHFPFSRESLRELEEECESELQYELLRELISVEHQTRTMASRRGIWGSFDKAFERSGWESPEEAITNVKIMSRGRAVAEEGEWLDYEDLEIDVIDNPHGVEMT